MKPCKIKRVYYICKYIDKTGGCEHLLNHLKNTPLIDNNIYTKLPRFNCCPEDVKRENGESICFKLELEDDEIVMRGVIE